MRKTRSARAFIKSIDNPELFVVPSLVGAEPSLQGERAPDFNLPRGLKSFPSNFFKPGSPTRRDAFDVETQTNSR
jgi:hypothetical protein